MVKYPILFTFLLMSFSIFATSFIPVSVKRQINEASGIIEGEVVNTESSYDDKGLIQTKVFLKLDKWLGVEPVAYHSEIYIPGGSVGDKVLRVEGAPSFKEGERVVLMLKNDRKNNKQWVLNLGLGKFSIKKIGNTEILVNSIFPRHPKASQISLDVFYSLATRLKNQKFESRRKNKYELELEKYSEKIRQGRVSRSIASVKSFKDKEQESKDSRFWIILIFGLLGASYTFVKRRSRE